MLKKLKKILSCMCVITTLSFSCLQTFAYTNGVPIPEEWYNDGIGDPFIMKYNGVYYLYCSAGQDQWGFQCWSSTDAVNWTYEGLCSTESITNDGYAPEVYYWNGIFYMYTSPKGQGHYVLTSDSPTGPFTVATENFGRSIDGSVFIDDDGSWYFYYASGDGIHGAPMYSPTSIGPDQLLQGVQISGGWTEGATVIKKDGIYYLTYTGNHVLSPGYRVNLAMSTEGPLGPYTPSTFNPIILNSEGSHVGLGHSSMFRGPDLDTYYTVYHNLTGVAPQGWPIRGLNIDAIGWNGEKMVVYGPTSWLMPDPSLPDFEDRFEDTNIDVEYGNLNGGIWEILDKFLIQSSEGSIGEAIGKNNVTTESSIIVTTDSSIIVTDKNINLGADIPAFIQYEKTFITADDYTAEFNVQEITRGETQPRYGVVFGYVDEDNYGYAVLNGETKQLQTNLCTEGEWGTEVSTDLPEDFDSTKLHTIRIEKSGTTYKFFVDNMLKETRADEGLGAGYIGYLSQDNTAQFGYMACSNKVNGNGIFDFYKPIPGTIEAVHYNTDGYYDTTSGNTEGGYIRNDNVDITDCIESGYNITSNTAGEWYEYNVSVQTDGTYNVGIRYKTENDNTKVKVWFDSTDATGEVALPNTEGEWQTYTLKGLNLEAGNHTLKVETVSGEYDLYTLQFYKANNAIINKTDNFDSSFGNDWNWSGGNWSIENGEASIDAIGKRTFGSTGWSDYTVECDIKGISGLNAGIMVRVQNPAQGGAGDDSSSGTDFYQGYFAGLTPDGVVLGKQNYNWTVLDVAPGSYDLNISYHMKVVVSGNNIKVYVEDMDEPKIDYTDNDKPFINGKVGLRAHHAHTHFDNFSVTQPEGTEGYSFTIESTSGGKVLIGESKKYAAEDRITISAEADLSYKFVGWTSSGGGSFENVNSEFAIFTMPENETTVSANFTPMDQSDIAEINFALGKTAASNNSMEAPPTWSISNLTDGEKKTGYTSNTVSDVDVSADPIWVSVDLGQDTIIDTVKLFPRTDKVADDGSTLNYPEDFEIQVKSDGDLDFTTVKTIKGQKNPKGEVQEYKLDTPIIGREIRVLVTKLGLRDLAVNDPSRMQLSDIEVYNKNYPESIMIKEPSNLNLTTGESGHIVLEATLKDGSKLDVSKLIKTVTSSNENVVRIEENGLVIGAEKGMTTLTVNVVISGFEYSCSKEIRVYDNSDIIDAPAPTIITQPQDKRVSINKKTSVSVEATASGTLAYQWYSNTTNSTSGGTKINTATDSILKVPTDTQGVTYYYCVVTNTDDIYLGNKVATITSESAAVVVQRKGNSDDSSPIIAPPIASPSGIEVLINDKSCYATSEIQEKGGKKETVVKLDEKNIETMLREEKNSSTITVAVNNNSDSVVCQLNGQTIKNMQTKETILQLKTENITYSLPASQVDMESVSNQMDKQTDMEDIIVNISIANSSEDTAQTIKDIADKNNYQMVVEPIDFEITCTSGDKTVDINHFDSYVERTVAIPDGVEQAKITTGIVLNKNGTFSHVPTKVISIDGKYYAKMNSLSNGSYSILWNPIEFKDVENHWSKESVNDMGSRLIINGISNDSFSPDQEITRAEFTAIVVSALGLVKSEAGTDYFSDVIKDAWYYDAVSIAYNSGIISGYGSGEFGSEDKVTREQAMVMITRAMQITKLNTDVEGTVHNILSAFSDLSEESSWAEEAITACIKTEIITGSNGKLVPKDNITRAEVVVMVRKLLQKSNLI